MKKNADYAHIMCIFKQTSSVILNLKCNKKSNKLHHRFVISYEVIVLLITELSLIIFISDKNIFF